MAILADKKSNKYQQWLKWYNKNKEHRDVYKKQYDQKYYLENQDKKKAITKQWQNINRSKLQEYYKNYYLSNKELFLQKASNWQKANPEKVREKNLRWIRKNPERRNFSLRQNKRARRNAEGSHTLEQWETLKRKHNYICLRCMRQEPEIELTEDHIVPITKGGSNDISNIQPLCRSCNCKKHVRIMDYRKEIQIAA